MATVPSARRTFPYRIALLVLVLAAPAATAQTASFQGLGDLPGNIFFSEAHGVSADGAFVVGMGRSASGSEAFRWTAAGGMVGLGDLSGGSFGSRAHDVSADGAVIVGTSDGLFDGGMTGDQAFRWTADGMVGLGNTPSTPPGSGGSFAQGVSNDGAVLVGRGAGANNNWEAVRWTTTGGFVGLGYLPGGIESYGEGISADGSVVVGKSLSATVAEAFRWTAAGGMVGLGDLPGGSLFSNASDVSADGTVVVGHSVGGNELEAFRWTAAGGMVGLGALPGSTFSTALDVSADGAVVVGESNNASGFVAVIWTAATGMVSLRAALVARGVDLTGWTLSSARAVSDDGRVVVGSGTNPQGQSEAWRAVLRPAAPAFVVTSAADSADAVPGNGRCDTDAATPGDQCTLRAALQESNLVATPGAAPHVTFAIPGGGAPGIAPTSALPAITRAVTLDGTTQPGGLVGLDGHLLSGAVDGLRVTAGRVTVRGLAVTRFPGYGLRVDGATGVRVAGNRLGVAPDGLREANRAGALRLTNAAEAAVGARAGRDADRNVLFGPLVADAGTRARVYLNTLEMAVADAEGLGLRAPLDVADDGPTCGTWARTPTSVPSPPRVLALSPTRVRGLAAPGDTVAVYRVAALGAGNGRYWARRAEPLALVAADAAGAFAASVALGPGDRIALTALSADGRTSELSQARRPVIFAPGIGGTWLRAADGTDLWLPLAATDDGRNDRMRRVAMQPDGRTSVEPVVATEIIEGIGPARIVYGHIHDRLAAAGYTGDPFNANAPALDQWRFPNDWRRSAAVLAGDFRALVDRLTTQSGRSAASTARACQVDVVAHSNGGVIAGVYLRRDAAHARDRVHRFVSTATPYLGADQALAAHTTGYIFGFDEVLNGKLPGAVADWNVAWGDMVAMTRNVPGAYGLIPSRAYFDAASPSTPSHAHGFSLVDLFGAPLLGYDATMAFLEADKGNVLFRPPGMARNAGIRADQQDAVHNLIDDWRAYEGPPHIFRHVGLLVGQTEVGWFMGPGPEALSATATPRSEAGDTDRHRAYRERLRPIFGLGDRTVPLLSSTLGRNALVGDTDLSGVDESAWIEEFEAYACGHGPIVEPGCRPVGTGGADALERIVVILTSGSVVPAAAATRSPEETSQETPLATGVGGEVVYVMATAPVSVSVTDAQGRLTGPPDPAAPNDVQYGVPDVAYVPSVLGASVGLPADRAYTVRVTSASPGAVVTLVRQRVSAKAVTQVLYADQPLAPGGTLTLGLAAAGTPAETPWARDADGNGTPDGSVAPAAVLPGTASVPALPFPQPTAFDVGAANRSDVRTATLRLPDTGTSGWTYTLAEDAPWLALSATAGSSPAGVTLTLNPAGLPDGRVSTSLSLALSNGSYTFRTSVPVTLRVGVVVATAPDAVPAETALHGATPNPLGGPGTVRYDLAVSGPVRLSVYDLLGREVAVLADGERAAGTYGVALDAGRLAPGAYVVRLTAGPVVQSRRLTVVR